MYAGLPTTQPVSVKRSPAPTFAIARAISEIGDQRVRIRRTGPAGQQHVLRFDVEMHDALFVRVRKCIRNLTRDAQRIA
jgi:hypothetical protein